MPVSVAPMALVDSRNTAGFHMKTHNHQSPTVLVSWKAIPWSVVRTSDPCVPLNKVSLIKVHLCKSVTVLNFSFSIFSGCVDFSHIANRIPPTTSTTSTTTVSYSTTSSEEEENQRQESEESAEIKPRSWRIQSHLVRIALGPVDQMRFKCTGTIISDRYVLTSAVCTESPT